MRWRFALCLLVVVVGIGGSVAIAQTRPTTAGATPSTQPAHAQWQDIVERVAQGLLDRNAEMLHEMLVDHPSVRSFDSQTDDASKLPPAVVGAVVLGVHTYPSLPATLATDIAADFSAATGVPEDVKRKMIPDDSILPRANTTARQWLQTRFDTAGGDGPVGVIVLWREHSNLDQISAMFKEGPGEVLFILLKGYERTGVPHIRQIVYGDPLASAN